jgi:uncharacterized protein
MAKRNVVIYIIGVLSLSTIGGIVTASGNEIGGLIFIISPILMMVLLRFLAKDSWDDTGLRLKLKEQWRWYLFSFLAYPIAMAIVIAMGIALGVTQLNGDIRTMLPVFASGLLVQFLPRMIFAMCEEWGWRGYLEPRLTVLNMPDRTRYVFVGFIWAIWHFPFILSTKYTEIPYAIFFPIFVLGVIVASIVYGHVRKASGTLWTAVLMHGTANTIGWSILQNNVITFNNKLLAAIAPESILMIVIWGMLGWWLVLRRKAK